MFMIALLTGKATFFAVNVGFVYKTCVLFSYVAIDEQSVSDLP